MNRVGVRELKQNASAVLRQVHDEGPVLITDRGREVAQIVPLGEGPLERMLAAGILTPPTGAALSELSAPTSTVPLSCTLADMRDDER